MAGRWDGVNSYHSKKYYHHSPLPDSGWGELLVILFQRKKHPKISPKSVGQHGGGAGEAWGKRGGSWGKQGYFQGKRTF